MPTVASQSSRANTQGRAERFAIVADDLTGAADTGVAFLTAGVSVVVGWTDDVVRADADVVAISTGSRAMDAGAARARTAAAVDACRRAGVSILYKKIDSLLRGHVGVEIAAALSAWAHDAFAIVAPAFPATGRATLDGRLVVDDARAARDGVSIVDLLTHDGLRAVSIDLATVRGGALADMLRHERSRGITYIVCDAESDGDLRAIADVGRALGSGVIWVGSGGLAHAIAATLPAQASVKPAGYDDSKSALASGPVLFVVGSRSAVAREQAEALVDDGIRRIVVPADRLAPEAAAAGGALAIDVAHALERGEDVLVIVDESAVPVEDDASLMTRLGEALRPCESLVGGLVVTGGDTAVGVLSAWGITGLRLVDELEPGIVLSSAIGSDALPVVTKSGSFGDGGTLVRVRMRLRKED